MSGTMGRRSGLAGVEARAQPAYRSPIARNRGTTWSFPGFGRDPELSPPPARPPTLAPTVAATVGQAISPPVVAPTPVAAPVIADLSFGNDGGGNAGSDMGADFSNNPGLYSNRSLESLAYGLGIVGPEFGGESKGVNDGGFSISTSNDGDKSSFGPDGSISDTAGGGGFNTSTSNDGDKSSFGPDGSISDTGGAGQTGGDPGAPGGDPGAEASTSGGDMGGGAPGDSGDGYMRGGYTGAGKDGIVDPTQPAGTVHEGEVVIPAHQVARHGLDPLMALAGPGAKMGPMPALGMVQAQGGGLPPQGDFSVPPFQTPSHGNGASPPPHMAGSPMAPASEIDGAGMDMDEPFDMAQPSDDFMHGMGPYAKEADYADPFKAPDPSKGATGSTATSAIGQLTPDAQAAVLQALGSDPMAASALLQVLGPSFRDLIAQALKANAPPQQPMAGAGGMMGGPPGMMA